MQRGVIKHFYFCNSEQIQLARRFLSHFVVEINTIFDTNYLNMPLSIFFNITNMGLSFSTKYCYISSKNKKKLFVYVCMYVRAYVL